jgi:hypothetical protein
MCHSFFRCEAARILLGGAKLGRELALKLVPCSYCSGKPFFEQIEWVN